MALHTLNFWEIVFDATQILLCGIIILFLILNRIKFKQLILRAPAGGRSQQGHTEFRVEAVRQQTELAFNHIVATIDKERQTLDAYYLYSEKPTAPGLLPSVAANRHEHISSAEATVTDAADVIYSEIESLADQGLSLADISERLNVPQGEVDLVLKLKNLSGGADKRKSHPSV